MSTGIWFGNEETGVSVTTSGPLTPEAMRIVLGLDPARDGSGEPVYAVQARARVLRRPAAPRRRRGLTGKRYRIARRRYARAVKAWERGIGEPIEVHYYLPRASVDVQVDRVLADKVATIRGLSAQFTILDEAEPVPYWPTSPQGAKPGYAGEHE